MTKIRCSYEKDSAQILKIWREAVDATHDFLTHEDRQAIEQEVIAFLPSAPLWLAVDDNDRAIGFMLLDDAHMEALFIDPAHHGKGVGRALVTHATQSHSALTTDVNEQNHQAIGFYEHIGFKKMGLSDLDGQGRPYPLIHLKKTSA